MTKFTDNSPTSSRLLKVDFHVHTSADPVDNLPLDAVATIELAAKNGFDAIALTHHDLYLRETNEIREASQRTGVLVLPGIEATLDGGCHVVIINADAKVEQVRCLAELAEYRSEENLIFPAHPFYPPFQLGAERLERWAHIFDAVEWSHFWSKFLSRPNRLARSFCDQHGMPMVGTGDVHLPDQMNSTYSLVEAEKEVGAVAEAVRAGRVQVVSEPIPLWRMVSVLGRLTLRNQICSTKFWRQLPEVLWPSQPLRQHQPAR